MAMLSVSKLTGAVVGFLEGLGPGVPAPTPWAEPVLAQIPVVGQQYCAPYTVDLTVANKAISISDGDFAVTDANGNLVFKVKSKVLSLRDRRVLVDAAGNTIISMQQKLMSIRKKWEVFKGESTDKKDLLFSTKKSSLIQFKTELDVFLASNTSKKVCDFKIKGSYLERSCSIFLGETNTIIAQMSRKYSVTNVVMGKDTFGVTICSNMDHAFIVALIVILHDINKEKEV